MAFMSVKYNRVYSSAVSFIALGTVLLFSGCDLATNQTKMDRAADMERQDFRDGLAPRDLEFENFSSEGDGIPPLESYVASVPDNLRPMPLVSLSVNQTIPLKNVLYDLAEQADYDVELDPRITGSIIFTARDRPFDMVIDRISKIAGLRYNFTDDIVRIELDTPYTETYKIDYLSIVRTSSSAVSNNISVVTGEGADTGSEFSISSESESDFWEELNENITQILESNAGKGSLKTETDPTLSVVSANPQAPVVSVEPVAESEVLGEDGTPVPSPGQDQSAPPVVQPPNVTLQVGALPTSTDSANANDVDFTPAFSMNKQAGMISVYANERIHEEIVLYLDAVKKAVSSQVLIEAKILEVTLNDEFATGVNWNDLSLFSGNVSAGFGLAGRPAFSPSDANNSLFVNYTSGDISTVVEAVSRFGTVRALASPRLTVLNNQPAALNVAKNSVYFEIDIDVTTDQGVTQTDIDSDIRNVPEGVLINVMPTINLEDQTITMQVRPTITRIVNRIQDPAIQFVTAAANITGVVSEVPEINVQEMDSVLLMNSGEVAILGGLLQDRTDSEQESIPVLGEVPILGHLFRSQGDSIKKTELVVFLKATIVENGRTTIHQVDRDLYKTFSNDRRPLKL